MNKNRIQNGFAIHFEKVDPILFGAYQDIGGIEGIAPRPKSEFFVSLCSAIVSQQLSGRVANVIFGRFEGLFPQKKITPEKVLKLSHETLRKAGMSNGKASYIRDLAQKVHASEVRLELLRDLENEHVILELTKIKGIGRWTAEMFLMFTLGREDVFSHGDLGLRKAIERLYNLQNPTKEQIEAIAIKWSPYRTYASRILWGSLDNR